MVHHKKYTLVLFLFIHSSILETVDKEKQKIIEELEKEKDELYSKIRGAIDNNIKSLQSNNDSDAKDGINYMENLKKQINILNDTDTELMSRRKSESMNVQTANSPKKLGNDSRRFIKRRLKQKYKFIDPELLQNKHSRNVSKHQRKDEERKVVQTKIDEWLEAVELENEKIAAMKKELQEKGKKNEICPPHGLKGRKRKQKKYPCCRKCCKYSYMGCL